MGGCSAVHFRPFWTRSGALTVAPLRRPLRLWLGSLRVSLCQGEPVCMLLSVPVGVLVCWCAGVLCNLGSNLGSSAGKRVSQHGLPIICLVLKLQNFL